MSISQTLRGEQGMATISPRTTFKVLVGFTLIGIGLLALASMAQAQPSSALPGSNYQVFAFNDLGMHCYDKDFSVFCLLPPFNVVHSQVVSKGLKPRLLDDGTIRLTYSGIFDPSGSINTTSADKTNFWQYIFKLFGINRSVDVGILGYSMPGIGNQPQSLSFDANPWPGDPKLKWFSATGIPITNIDNQGNTNSYPMMRIQAFDLGQPNQMVSSLDIVLPVSSEMRCAACHETDSWIAADNAAGIDWVASDASPPPRLTNLTADSFSNNPNFDIRYRENILILHDAMNPGYTLFEQYQSGQPILCAQCHYSKALDLAGTGPTVDQKGHLYLSRAMHKHHGTAWPTGAGGMGGSMAGGGYTVPIPGTGVQRCYSCHPGNDTQCLRSVMAVNGMQCQSCHGDLLALAGFTPQLGLPHAVDRLPADPALLTVKLKTTGEQRRPWVDLPKCQSCHTGDALNYLGPKIVGRQAYANEDAATASPILAPNSRFAENNGLHRFSQTHGGVACEACHGSPHAEWPARTNTNDNLTATQIQGHTGEIAECGACHTGDLPPGLKGPHGIHNINDPTWGGVAHGIIYKQDHAACKACHGRDLKGTVLSRAKDDRTLLKAANQQIAVTRGTMISCYACHNVVQ